jgi:hypothetical protein
LIRKFKIFDKEEEEEEEKVFKNEIYTDDYDEYSNRIMTSI